MYSILTRKLPNAELNIAAAWKDKNLFGLTLISV